MEKGIQIFHQGIHFTVSYATELLGVMSILCNDQDAVCDAGAELCNAEYRNEILCFFSDWKVSEVTKLLERFSDEYNFNYDAPVDLMLQLQAGVSLDMNRLLLHRKPIPQAQFDHFVDLIFRFEAESRFREFYDAHRPYYEDCIRRFIADYDAYAPLNYLTNYLNMTSGPSFHINLMLGITNSNYGVTVGNDLYANLCPYHKTRFASMPDYSCSPIYWTTLIVHEFAHGFVNPVTARHRQRIGHIDPAPYREIMKEMMYGESLETYINETIIRALECQYVARNFPSSYEEYVRDYEDMGFFLIRQVIDMIQPGFLTGNALFEQLLTLFQRNS